MSKPAKSSGSSPVPINSPDPLYATVTKRMEMSAAWNADRRPICGSSMHQSPACQSPRGSSHTTGVTG